MLDNISYQIFKALSRDGRCRYSELAKELNMKASTVSGIVNKMLEDDLISIQAVPNPFRIGYKFQIIAALNIDIGQTDKICSALMDNPNISSIAVMYGRFDILFFAEFPSMNTLIKLMREYLPQIKGVNQIDTFFVSESKKSYEKLFSQGPLDPVPLDKVDEQLIHELQKNGRANLAQLAKKYNISLPTATRRVASLISKNVIKITAIPNHTKLLGFSAVAYLVIQAELNKVSSVCEILSQIPEIYNIMTLLNRFNILAILVLPDHESLYKFILNKIKPIDGVIFVETLIRAELKKRTYVYVDDAQILSALENGQES